MENKKEIKILFATACTSSSIDQQSNTVSLFNILEDIKFDLTLQDKKITTPEEIGYRFSSISLLFLLEQTAQKQPRKLQLTQRLHSSTQMEKHYKKLHSLD